MASHDQRRRRPRPRHVAARGGAGSRARRLGFRPRLSGRQLTVVACAASLLGLLVTLPSAIGARRSASQVAVATSSTPTTVAQASTTVGTSATRTRPRMALSATASTGAATTTATTSGRRSSVPAAGAGWINVVNDQFDFGGVPAHWNRYDGPYGSEPRNCATPSHVSVSGGSMHLLMRHEASGGCGAGWYTAGMMLDRAFASVDQRVTVRFRVVSGGVSGHHIIPMRFPPGAPWPQNGEEDYCEGDGSSGCFTFLHYGDTATTQVWHRHAFDLSRWHTVRFERRDHVVKAYIDDLTTPVWTYNGSSRTLPDSKKHVVLQQECLASGCPAGTAGTEDVQIDWITIDNPA